MSSCALSPLASRGFVACSRARSPNKTASYADEVTVLSDAKLHRAVLWAGSLVHQTKIEAYSLFHYFKETTVR